MFDSLFFNRAARSKILVIGDVMLDKFYHSKLNKFSSDAPIPVAKIVRKDSCPGGAANVARCLATLGVKPLLAGFVGNDHNCEGLMELLYQLHIDSRGLIFTDQPTHTKIRVIARNHQVFRLDFDDDTPYPDGLSERLLTFTHNALNHALDAIIIADYEKGVCTERLCQAVIADAHAHGVPIIALPYGSNWIKYQHADCLVPNVNKLNRILLAPIDPSLDDACANAANYVRRKFDIAAVIATRSQFGLTLATAEDTAHFGTHEQLLVDPAGAADASCAASALAIAVGAPLQSAARFSNLVGGIAVSKPGSYAPTVGDILGQRAERKGQSRSEG